MADIGGRVYLSLMGGELWQEPPVNPPKIGDPCPKCGEGIIYKMNWAALNCDYCHTEWPRVRAT